MNCKSFNLFMLLIILQFGLSCSDGLNSEKMDKPIINSIHANPTNIYPRYPTTIVCDAYSKENNSFDYLWIIDVGTISGFGDSIIWTAPDKEGEYYIKCKVIDSYGNSTIDSTKINVVSFGDSIDTSIHHIILTDYNVSSDSFIVDTLFLDYWYRVGQDTNIYLEYTTRFEYHIKNTSALITTRQYIFSLPEFFTSRGGFSSFDPFVLAENEIDIIRPGGGVRLAYDKPKPPFYFEFFCVIKGIFIENDKEFDFDFNLLVPVY